MRKGNMVLIKRYLPLIILINLIFMGQIATGDDSHEQLESYLKNIRDIAISELQNAEKIDSTSTNPQKDVPEKIINERMLLILESVSALESDSTSEKAITSVKKNLADLKIPRYVEWQHLDDAITQAKKEEKLLLLDFYADWCGPCRMLDENVFSDPDTARKINSKFVAVKVDVDDKNTIWDCCKTGGFW